MMPSVRISCAWQDADPCKLRYVTWWAGVTLPESGIRRWLHRSVTYRMRNRFHALFKLVAWLEADSLNPDCRSLHGRGRSISDAYA
jgi:hypothetical protein